MDDDVRGVVLWFSLLLLNTFGFVFNFVFGNVLVYLFNLLMALVSIYWLYYAYSQWEFNRDRDEDGE